MGIRAVQAGALTSAFDRPSPGGPPRRRRLRPRGPIPRDRRRAWRLPAYLAHRYALSVPGVSTVVLGVKDRRELRECIDAEAAGPLDPSLIQRIDEAVGHA